MSQDVFSFANLANLPEIEELYEKYLRDPKSVDPSWKLFFDGMQFASFGRQPTIAAAGSSDLRIHLLINAYRIYGHLMAHVNPLATEKPAQVPELDLQKLGFKQEELEKPFPTAGFLKEKEAPLKKIVEALANTYCRTIGIEYMDLGESAVESWLQQRIEPNFELRLTPEERIDILHHLNKAEIFESFIHTKYVGQKRFSLEGAETMIPLLLALIEKGAEEGIEEAVVGMAHRGRLNVLANILNKSYSMIFHEFEDHYTPDLLEGTGDVKYHRGFKGELRTKSGKEVHVALTPNPSHLEAVDPIVEGHVRALQELKRDKAKRKTVVPILVHGDAALAGQGVVYETIQLSRLNGYGTSGTVHIVINNQIGFTTLPKDSRSTRYCTDIAKAFGAPVFHVNAEDPEACVAVAKLAIALRQTFECDVFIDLIGYRKYGHNESDEPTFTQPLEYQQIQKRQSIRSIYRERLIQEGIIDQTKADSLEKEFKEGLQKALEMVPKKADSESVQPPAKENGSEKVETKISVQAAQTLAKTFCTVPEGFNIHPKVKRLLQERLAMVADATKPQIDWGMGEHLAYASLLVEGTHIRISGQDVRRGTFSHRHGMWIDNQNSNKYFPLSHLSKDQALFDLFNSALSEFATLGFEFGYSLFYPNSLTIWEAQFGDFANGAQVIIDQFLSSSEQKWNHGCNLTLFLPHGYEGQGPEHSSGRIERFLQLCGEENMQVANVTTPAQLFHLIRRQAKRKVQKPLILFTPKALLRHPLCVSSLNDFAAGGFEEMLDDPRDPKNPRRLILCSGKVYYDLVAEREKRAAFDVALVRIEQLYPLNSERLKQLVEKYKGFKECFWVQEEHQNMGAWEYIRAHIDDQLNNMRVNYVGRGRSAATAAGSYALHKKQLAQLLEEAFR
ncbi:MAG: 2-oxoglutarate dehydrogenase E1 component [Chlamydiales bacterium]|nr:2-oxoglutarate dehydrogenase E1 component [Chlamydiales bacterium]